MNNGNIYEQLDIQEQQITNMEIQPAKQQNIGRAMQTDIPILQQSNNKQYSIYMPELGLSSIASLLITNINDKKKEQALIKRKKKLK